MSDPLASSASATVAEMTRDALALAPCTDPADWNAFVAASPQSTVFCRAPFLGALGLRHELWWVTERGTPRLGAVIVKDDAGVPLRAPFPLSLYQGLLLHPAHAALPVHSRVPWTMALVERLLGGLEVSHDRLSFCLHPSFEDARAFSWFHYHEPQRGRFRIELYYTGWIDLASPRSFDEFLSSIRETRRHEYRRALAAGLTVEPSKDVDMLAALYRETFSRQGIDVDPAADRRLRAVAASALAEGYGELLLCRTPAGEAASATLFLYDERCGYYLLGANHPAHRRSGAGTFLVLQHIRRCRDRGLQRVDVCGMNSPNRGDFKASFNAVPVPYFVVIWDSPPRTACMEPRETQRLKEVDP